MEGRVQLWDNPSQYGLRCQELFVKWFFGDGLSAIDRLGLTAGVGVNEQSIKFDWAQYYQ